MRYLRRFALAFTAIVAATAAAQPTPLRVGTSGDYPPFSSRSPAGALSGFDVEVARRLAADLGRPVEFVPFRWPELMDRLTVGAFDLAMSGITVRPDRAIQGAYTRPYARSGAVAVLRTADRTRYATLAALDHDGVRLVVNAGGHLERLARERFPHATITAVTDNRSLPTLLRDRAADAAISDELEAHTWTPGPFAIIGPFSRDRKAYLVRPTANELRQQTDEWLAAREADEWLNTQRRRWFRSAVTETPIAALVAAMDLRLQLMPFVAAVKRRAGVPIDDAAQEQAVLQRVRTTAVNTGLEPDAVTAFMMDQIALAKTVQRAHDKTPLTAPMTLASVRAAVGRVTDQLLTELVRATPWLRRPPGHARLVQALETDLAGADLTADQVARVAETIGRVAAGPGRATSPPTNPP